MTITRFSGDHAFLSNFYPATVTWLGVEFYPTVEHAYQAAKTEDPQGREMIRQATTPGIAKRLGRKVPMRRDWDEIKLNVMLNLVHQKFYDHDDLRRMLLDTGDQMLIEGNTWGDTFWGVYKGFGYNHLGHILMQVRDLVRR